MYSQIESCLAMWEIQIVRSRRKTLSLEITGDGDILVRAPIVLPEQEIRRFVNEKSEWISKHLQKIQQDKENLCMEGAFSEQEVERMVNLAKCVIPEKVTYYARIMDVSYGKISVRKQKTRWGSCSKDGNLSFNCLLMMTPPEVLDYVVVHELCHRMEMNHSQKFWAHVERVLPDYKKSRRWLKENGNRLMIRMK